MKTLPEPSSSLLDLLKKVDTPTVCNAIEVVEGKRGFAGFTRQQPLAAHPHLPPLVGFARTARVKGSSPSSRSSEKVKEARMNYYRFMYDAPKPSVCVIEDLDYPHGVGAFWGEVNSNIHKAFGMEGTLTNGLMRDLGDMAKNYQVLAGSVGPSHAFVHVIDFGEKVTLFGLDIDNQDFIHADRHGAVVIPPTYLNHLEEAIHKLIHSEKIILDALQGDCTWEKFEKGWSDFEKSRI